MADFRGEKTVEINIRTRVGQASGVKGPSSRPGVVRIEVPESFRFLSGVELDQSDVEQLRKLPPSQRGQAIYGSKFLKNKQSGPESLRSSALDIQTLMNRQGGLTVREMLENFNRYNIARNNPSLANRVKMYDSPSSQSHIQSNQMLKEGLGQIAGAALAFPALRGASLAIGALPQVPRMMASIGLGLSWLSSAREGKGPLTIPNWLMGRRNDATGGMAGLTRGFEVASEAMMLGDLTKGAGNILSGLGFGGRAKAPGSQTPNQPNSPQGPAGGGGGGGTSASPGGNNLRDGRFPNSPNIDPAYGDAGAVRDPHLGFPIDRRFLKYSQGRKADWGLDVKGAMAKLGIYFHADNWNRYNPQKLSNLVSRFKKIIGEQDFQGKIRDFVKRYEATDSPSDKQSIRDEFTAYLNNIKGSIKDYESHTYKGNRTLPDGEFAQRPGKKDDYTEVNPIEPQPQGVGGGQSPAKPPKEPPPEEDGGVATMAPPENAQKPGAKSKIDEYLDSINDETAGRILSKTKELLDKVTDPKEREKLIDGIKRLEDKLAKSKSGDGTKDSSKDETKVDVPVTRAPKPKQGVEISPEQAEDLIRRNLTPPDLRINDNPRLFPNPLNDPEQQVNIGGQPQFGLENAVIGKPKIGQEAEPKAQPQPQPEKVKVPPKVAVEVKEKPPAEPKAKGWNFPSFGVPEDEQLPFKRYMGNFLPVAPSFHSAKIKVPGHIINSGRLDYGD